ncbi:hypothetical protein WA158_008316 [Blastocystis sp. Blastoise]
MLLEEHCSNEKESNTSDPTDSSKNIPYDYHFNLKNHIYIVRVAFQDESVYDIPKHMLDVFPKCVLNKMIIDENSLNEDEKSYYIDFMPIGVSILTRHYLDDCEKLNDLSLNEILMLLEASYVLIGNEYDFLKMVQRVSLIKSNDIIKDKVVTLTINDDSQENKIEVYSLSILEDYFDNVFINISLTLNCNECNDFSVFLSKYQLLFKHFHITSVRLNCSPVQSFYNLEFFKNTQKIIESNYMNIKTLFPVFPYLSLYSISTYIDLYLSLSSHRDYIKGYDKFFFISKMIIYPDFMSYAVNNTQFFLLLPDHYVESIKFCCEVNSDFIEIFKQKNYPYLKTVQVQDVIHSVLQIDSYDLIFMNMLTISCFQQIETLSIGFNFVLQHDITSLLTNHSLPHLKKIIYSIYMYIKNVLFFPSKEYTYIEVEVDHVQNNHFLFNKNNINDCIQPININSPINKLDSDVKSLLYKYLYYIYKHKELSLTISMDSYLFNFDYDLLSLIQKTHIFILLNKDHRLILKDEILLNYGPTRYIMNTENRLEILNELSNCFSNDISKNMILENCLNSFLTSLFQSSESLLIKHITIEYPSYIYDIDKSSPFSQLSFPNSIFYTLQTLSISFGKLNNQMHTAAAHLFSTFIFTNLYSLSLKYKEDNNNNNNDINGPNENQLIDILSSLNKMNFPRLFVLNINGLFIKDYSLFCSSFPSSFSSSIETLKITTQEISVYFLCAVISLITTIKSIKRIKIDERVYLHAKDRSIDSHFEFLGKMIQNNIFHSIQELSIDYDSILPLKGNSKNGIYPLLTPINIHTMPYLQFLHIRYYYCGMQECLFETHVGNISDIHQYIHEIVDMHTTSDDQSDSDVSSKRKKTEHDF